MPCSLEGFAWEAHGLLSLSKRGMPGVVGGLC